MSNFAGCAERETEVSRMSDADTALFPGFAQRRIPTSGAEIQCVIGGSGPPLLLLHGYPQTHAMWHKIAPCLAEQYTVVCADLRGYGDSSKPDGGERSANYSKRAMAADQVEVMRALGFSKFRLAGHDRGGRVAHRLVVDHPEAVERVAVLDISPTRTMFGKTDQAFATAYYHWFFLIQPFDLPERLIGSDPIYYLRKKTGGWGSAANIFDARALLQPGPPPSRAWSSCRCARRRRVSRNRRSRAGPRTPPCIARQGAARSCATSHASADSRAAGGAAVRCRRSRSGFPRRMSRYAAARIRETT
jgi:pimeloyl-ACP methyl ester carboxylesterase